MDKHTCKARCCRAFPVLEWLEAHGVRPKPALAHLLRYLFEHADQVRNGRELCWSVRIAESTANNLLRKRKLPALRRWVAAARGLGMVRSIRAGDSVFDVAFHWDYADHSGVSRALRETFGVSARDVRGSALEERELMNRWLERHQRRRGRPRKAAA